MLKVSAPGKIILAGEHAVVYGKPALVAAVKRRVTVKIEKRKMGVEIFSAEPSEQIREALRKFKETYVVLNDRRSKPTSLWRGLKIYVGSEIPVKVGMGSSAAVAVATVGALLAFSKNIKRFSDEDKELINKIAYQVEKKIHGNPSGVDNTISTFGGFLWFQKGKHFKKIKLAKLPRFILVNTGKAEETTGEMVEQVSSKFKVQSSKLNIFFNQIEKQVMRLTLALRGKNTREIKNSIRENEKLLEELGIVGQFAKKVVREIESAGGVAKICGAGGVKDRSGVLLCYHKNQEKIFALAKKLGLEAFAVKLGEEGVRTESHE